jgi:hypothetical protein
MMPKKEPKKSKVTRPDLDIQKQKEILARREIAKKSKLPKGIFEDKKSSKTKM